MLIKSSIVNCKSPILPGHPQNHSRLLREFGGKVLDAAVLHACGHAMLHASGFESLSCQMRAQDADLCREWKIGEICTAVGKLLFHLEYFDTTYSGLMTVFLGAGEFAAVAPGAVFVINQQTMFGFLPIHDIHPAPVPYTPCITGF